MNNPAQRVSISIPESNENEAEIKNDPEDVLLLTAEIPYYALAGIRNTDKFSFFGGRLHVVLLTKLISIACLPFYLCILAFVILFGTATTVMFAAIILGSVSAFTIYGAFKGSKLCLIPFIFMQIIFLIYDIVLISLLLYAYLNHTSYLYSILDIETNYAGAQADIVVPLTGITLCLLLIPLLVTTYIVYLDFVFILQLDETLGIMKERNELYSKDEHSPEHGAF